MPFSVSPLIYTSFPKVGFQLVSCAGTPPAVETALVKQVVHANWDPYLPPPSDFRSVFVHQVSLRQTLFGWLINDGVDDLGREHTPYCLSYFLAQVLDVADLEAILGYLAQGPIVKLDRGQMPTAIAPIELPNLDAYQPEFAGVSVPQEICDRSFTNLAHHHFIQFIHGNR